MGKLVSFFLGAVPNALEGAARILDFGNTLTVYNTSSDPTEADVRAMRADWSLLGSDMRSAIRSVKNEIEGSSSVQ